jgi:DHA3 family tetracycline resistance protein-like MFS transporter
LHRKWPAVRVYLAVQLLQAVADSTVFTIVAVYYVRVVGMSPFELVLVGTCMEAAIFLFEIPTGVVADVYSRRLSAITGWTIMGAAVVVVGLVASAPVILVAWAVWGLGYTFTSGAWQAWLTDEIGVDAVGSVFVRGTRISYAGAILGTVGGVVLAATVSLGFAICVGGGVTLLTAALAIATMPEAGFRRQPRGDRRRRDQLLETAAAATGLIRARPLLLVILAIFLFAGASTEAFDRLFEAHLLRDVGLPKIGSLDPVYWFGIFSLVGMALGFVLSTLLLRRMRAAGHRALATTLLVLTALELAGLTVFALAGGLTLAIAGLYLYSTGRGLAGPLSMTWLNQSIPDSSVRATVISVSGQSDAIGQVAGGPGIGALGSLVSLRAALLAGAALLVPAVGLFARALRHRGHDPELEGLSISVEETS